MNPTLPPTVADEHEPPSRPKVAFIKGWQDNVPQELKRHSQWVGWRYQFRDSRWTKVPVYLKHEKHWSPASSKDPTTWTTWSKALTALRVYQDHAEEGRRIDGIGYVFTEGIVGVDLDQCLTGAALRPWAADWLERLGPTYAEVSPSGAGLKAFYRGTLPPKGKDDGRNRGNYNGDGTGKIELFHRGRYFTTTGNIWWEDHHTINTADPEALAALVAEVDGPIKEATKAKTTKAVVSVPLDDHALLEKACKQRAGKGDEFRRLYYLGARDDEDHSAADYALINDLLYWCGPDEARVDQLFRASALFRSKWADRSDYGLNSIRKAIATRTAEYYDPQWRPPSTNGHHDLNAERPDPPVPYDPCNGNGAAEPGQDPRAYFLANYTHDGAAPRGRTIAEIGDELVRITAGWPKRIGERLFCRAPAQGPVYLSSPARLFAWIGLHAQADWASRDKVRLAVTQEQFYEHLRMNVEQFDDLELMPHHPPMPGTYYLHRELPQPTSKLDALLDMLCPETDADRALIKAMVLTLFWGGLPGARPAFLVTGPTQDPEQGRGVGKSTLAEVLGADLAGGYLEVGAKDDMETVKTRLLSPEGRHLRVIRIDNLKTEKFSWSDLEAVITSSMISGRELYAGEGRRKNALLWLITVNGANLSKDMSQRVIPIRLKRPAEYGADWDTKIRTLVREHRWEISAEAIAILRSEPGTLKLKTRWAAWERDVLSKIARGEECQRIIAERQGVMDGDQDEKDEIISILQAKLEEYPRVCADECCLLIPSQVMADWINEGMKTRQATNRITALLNRIAIPQLEFLRASDARGWVWRGRMVPRDARPDRLPGDHRSRRTYTETDNPY